MQNTENFAFRKPDPTDNYAIGDQNTNWDTADTQIKSAQTAAAAAQTTANTAIPSTQKAAADGVATLDATTKVPLAQLPMLDVAHLPTGIPASKLADGSVTDTELEYINSLTSNAQDQITAIKTTADAAATNAALLAHEADYTLQVPYGGVTTGPANTYVLAAPAITALSAGMAVSVKFNVDSTGASTLNWNGKGAKGIKKSNGTDVTNLKATGIYTLRYDGANFILQGEGGSGNAIAAHLLAGETASTDAGDIVGTMANNGAGGTVTPGTANQTKAPGFWSSVITILGDIALIAANIMVTKTIFGVAGTATADATAGAGDIASGKTGYVNGVKVTGTGANAKLYLQGTVTSSIPAINFTVDNGSINSFQYVNVTGLNFPNGIQMIRVTRLFSNDNTFFNQNLLYTNSNISNNGIGGVRLTGNAFVTTTSFQLPVIVTNATYNYEIWGI